MMPTLLQKLFCIPQRWVVAIMGFFAFSNAYTLRVCLSMAITKMAKPLNRTEELFTETCPPYGGDAAVNATNITVSAMPEGTFEWTEYTQGIILSSFYWGYVLTHLPGGLLAEKFGAKHVIGLGVLLTAIFTIATPVATIWGGANALIALRFLMGLCQGVIQPAISCLMSKWVPPSERSFVVSFAFMGLRFGSLMSGVISGLILRNSSDDWPLIFYWFGGIAVLWFVFWLLLCYSSPREHPFIGDKERKYLDERMSSHTHEKAPPFPWKSALTSKAFLVVVIVQSGQDWENYTVMSDLPKYMYSLLKLPVHLNGYASSIHNIGALVLSLIASWVSDWSIERSYISRTNVRKINTALSTICPATFLLLSAYVGCDAAWVISLIVLGQAFVGVGSPGFKVNVLDLSPNYSGTLLGISNGIGASMGILAPYAVGLLVPNQALDEWRLIFWIVTVIAFMTTVSYLVFASGEVQEWNDPVKMKAARKRSHVEVIPFEDIRLLSINGGPH